MKPFNLEEAIKDPSKVTTRDGRDISEIYCFNASLYKYPLHVVIGNHIYEFTKEGFFDNEYEESAYDLFMKSNKKTYYVNIYKQDNEVISTGICAYHNYEKAIENKVFWKKYLKTISFEIEE